MYVSQVEHTHVHVHASDSAQLSFNNQYCRWNEETINHHQHLRIPRQKKRLSRIGRNYQIGLRLILPNWYVQSMHTCTFTCTRACTGTCTCTCASNQ